MTKFEIKILGCGSALPTTRHNPSAQAIEMGSKLFLMDCGEGTQLQMRRCKVSFGKLHSIFISHLHGDHVFGLPGLISTLNLLGRKADLSIYAHEEINYLLRPTLDYFCSHISFVVHYIPLQKNECAEIFDNKSIRITTFPLNHRIASNGFLFEEKASLRHIKPEMIEFYGIPYREILSIKEGNDFVTESGKKIDNALLTTPGNPAKRYAYCSDTAYDESIIPHIQGADMLYHEATFADSEITLAKQTFHSTARQAAKIAKAAGVKKLIIGHFSSRYKTMERLLDESMSVFPNTELADEGKRFSL